MINLTGPREERTLEAARDRIPLTAANVRHIIDGWISSGQNMKAAVKLAKVAMRAPMVSDEGKSVYAEFISQS